MSTTPHRSPNDAPYLWLSKDAQDRALEAGGTKGLAVYVALCRLESNAPQQYKGAFSASRFNISQFSGVSVRIVADLLPVLVRARLIGFQSGRHAGKDRSHEANKFTLFCIGVRDTENSQAPCVNSTEEIRPQERTFFPIGRKKGLRLPKGSAGKPKGTGFTSVPSIKIPTFIG
jgi:hypothetical protein